MQEIDKLKHIVENMGELPTLPSVFHTISNMLSDPHTSAVEIGAAISCDQVIASKVLKLVNSAFYGLPGRVSTVSHAIVILGFSSIKNIVLTTSILSAFKSKELVDYFDLTAFWKHSIATGAIARLIARESKFEKPEEAFTAGLLHDIGKLVFAFCSPKLFAKCIGYAIDKKCLFLEAENELLGCNHTDISKWVQEKWRLPNEIAVVLANHHKLPAESKENAKLVAIVQMADILARGLQIGHPCDLTIPVLPQESWDLLAFDSQKLDSVLAKSAEALQNSMAILSED